MPRTLSHDHHVPRPPLENPRTVVIRRIAITLVVVACIAGLAVAVAHTRRGDEEFTITGSPNVVQLLAPADGSNVLSQAQIEIDLDGALRRAPRRSTASPVPDDQLQKHPELNQVVFTPGAGQGVREAPVRPELRASRHLPRRRHERSRPAGPLVLQRDLTVATRRARRARLRRGGRRSPAGAGRRASSRIGTPSSSAFVSFAAPGASPTTTAVVFFDTLPGDLPPRALIASSASSRDMAFERAGDDDRLSFEHLRQRRRLRTGDVDARLSQLLDHLAIAVVLEELVHRVGDDAADAFDRRDVVLRSRSSTGRDDRTPSPARG